jgi:hypothetical protein
MISKLLKITIFKKKLFNTKYNTIVSRKTLSQETLLTNKGKSKKGDVEYITAYKSIKFIERIKKSSGRTANQSLLENKKFI